jgi:hypothetical protein
VLGLASLMPLLVAVPMGLALLSRHPVRLPRGFSWCRAADGGPAGQRHRRRERGVRGTVRTQVKAIAETPVPVGPSTMRLSCSDYGTERLGPVPATDEGRCEELSSSSLTVLPASRRSQVRAAPGTGCGGWARATCIERPATTNRPWGTAGSFPRPRGAACVIQGRRANRQRASLLLPDPTALHVVTDCPKSCPTDPSRHVTERATVVVCRRSRALTAGPPPRRAECACVLGDLTQRLRIEPTDTA